MDMTDVSAITTAIFGGGGALTVIGAGVKFIWDKVERRFKAIESELKQCRGRELLAENRSATMRTAVELLWQEVERLSPTTPNATLRRVKKLLDELKLPRPSLDLAALAEELDQRNKETSS